MAADDDVGEDGGQRETRWHAFKQQRMRAWQPIFTPRCTVPLYICSGMAFLGIGFFLVYVASGVVELRYDYTELVPENSTGSFSLNVEVDMEPPVWIYYELSDFFQNHRRYVKSYSGSQLSQADAPASASVLAHVAEWCNPEQVRDRDGRLLYPCGLVPLSVFNDSFVLLNDSTREKVAIDSEADTIAWPADLRGKFRNVDPEAIDEQTGLKNQVAMDMWILERFPPVECEQETFDDGYRPVRVATRTEVAEQNGERKEVKGIADCTGYMSETPTCNYTRDGQPFACDGSYREVRRRSWGVESGHLAVWMRIAGLPTFRKLLGKVDAKLERGNYTVFFENNFPVAEFGGRKALVLSTGSEWGGHGDALGWCYAVVGALCLLFGLCKLGQCFHRPRQLGDVRLLSK